MNDRKGRLVMSRDLLIEAYQRLDELDTVGYSLADETDPVRFEARLNDIVAGGEQILRDSEALGDTELLAETRLTIAAALMDLAGVENGAAARWQRLQAGISHCDSAVSLALDMESTAAGLDTVTLAMTILAGGLRSTDEQQQALLQVRTEEYIETLDGLYVEQHAIIGQATDDLMTGRLLFDTACQLDDASQRRLVWQEALQLVEGAERGLRLSDEPVAAQLSARTAGDIKEAIASGVVPVSHFDPVAAEASPMALSDATMMAVDPDDARTLFSAPAWQLRVLAGPALGQVFPLGQQTQLGRHEDNQIVLNDEQASRRHALIQHQGDNVYLISDLGSSNGTSVNGQRISQPTRLNAGDRIRIGGTEFEVMGGG